MRRSPSYFLLFASGPTTKTAKEPDNPSYGRAEKRSRFVRRGGFAETNLVKDLGFG